MKTKMTAVAMVAVMIVAAFAVVGMADSGAADVSTSDKEKDILGTKNNPYILHYSSDINENETVAASIEFNRLAFSNDATTTIVCNWTDTEVYDNNILSIGGNTLRDISHQERYKITLTAQNDINHSGVFSLEFKALSPTPDNKETEFSIKVTVNDVVTSNGKPILLPPQEYIFKAYIKAVDASNKSIQLEGDGVTDDTDENNVPKQKINFDFETDYSITSRVVVNGTDLAESFNYYAVGLPDGISMTVDGKIGGRLSSTLKTIEDAPFTVYAVSASGHVVSKAMTYSIGSKSIRNFAISIDGANDYVVKTVNESVNLKISPNGSTLKDVVISYSGENRKIADPIKTDYTDSFKCTGTGILKISVSATFDGSNVTVTKTITVYVVGEIFNTDLDPEVTN